MNLPGFLYKYKPVFNQQNLSAVFLALFFVQVTLPNSQKYYYENNQDDYIGSMQKFYESCSKKDSIEATDHDNSRLTTTSIFDYIKETIKSTALTVYLSYSNPTDHNLTNSIQEILDVDHN